MLFSLWSQTKTQSKWLQTGHYLWTFCLRKSRHRVTEFAHVESCSRLEVVFFNSLILRSLLWFFDIHPGLQVKTSHWKSLPWILAGLALPDEEAARSIARRCCTMYDNSEDLSPSAVYGRKHPLSRRFLDYSFGDGQSLRHDLDEFVRGVSRRDLDRFCAWCGALRLMKTTEQPTEGLHRSLHQIMSRAPNASPAYLSTESRLPMFGRAFNSPETLARLAQKNEDLCSHKDLTKAIAKLIGGPGCIPAEGRKISHSDLVHLLYHCHFKYDRGKQTALVLPTSTAQKLRENKHLTLNGCDMDVELFLVCIFDWAIGLLNSYSPATVWNGLFSNWLWLGLFRWIWTVLPAHTHTHHRQSLALEQRNAMPTMVRLLLDHFRKNLEAGAFYSLPREYIQEMGGNEASQYLQPALPSSQQQMATCSWLITSTFCVIFDAHAFHQWWWMMTVCLLFIDWK